MDDFLTDQQQAARVKTLLREYVPAAVAALAVGIGGYFGYTQWQDYRERQAAEASDLYEELIEALESNNRDSAGELHQRLLEEFEGSGYADHARLLMARQYIDTTQPSLAAEELEGLVATTKDEDLRQLARLRLARVYLYLDRPEDGLEVLQAEVNSPAWVQLTEDLRGDLLQTLGRIDEARVAYQAALDLTGQVDAGWIRLKLDNLGAVEVARTEAPSGATTRLTRCPGSGPVDEPDENSESGAALDSGKSRLWTADDAGAGIHLRIPRTLPNSLR